MRMLLIGAPGAGKGTQAVRVAEHFKITHVSSGDLLRKHVAEGTATGRAAQQYLNRGDLVPDGIVMDMLYKPVLAASKAGGYVLDGFPRTVEQAEAAYMVAQNLEANVQIAVHLDVPRDVLVRRLLTRGRGADDTAEVIERRLQVYEESTLPMLDYYVMREQLITIDGSQSMKAVASSLLEQLGRARTELHG
jgi:adenylate kinase